MCHSVRVKVIDNLSELVVSFHLASLGPLSHLTGSERQFYDQKVADFHRLFKISLLYIMKPVFLN